MGVYSGIPREAYDQLLEKRLGGQTVANLKLLSMSKKPTEEGRYFSEAESNRGKIKQRKKNLRGSQNIWWRWKK